MYVLLIDSGTTNSRIRLVQNDHTEQVVDVLKMKVGVRNTAIDGHNERLKSEIQRGIAKVIERNHLSADQVSSIVASGMITSNLGLYEVPHVTAPADLEDFVKHAKMVDSGEFFNIPCLFIPGMKNDSGELLAQSPQLVNEMDIMRGEEVEAFGLLKQLAPVGRGIMVLPGSHTKYVVIDQDQTLCFSLSTLGGEVLQAICSNTILSSSLNEKLVETIDTPHLLAGFHAAKREGLTRSFFHIRLLQLYSELDDNARANYFVGAVLQSDLQALDSYLEHAGKFEWMIVGGSNPLRSAFVHLLSDQYENVNIMEANDEQVEHALVSGAIEVGSQFFDNEGGIAT
ncbi:2-dehydro-3-deoxygalactonokinase [Halalkalibacter kiskunsagensis]|uniref:2-dehydro-3-deoxygalactonokinase n=1 Tax=Halalkalibacter kiskunsagensis TaxID=1548599 RepID=A0ABV6KFE8_9BACI